MGCRGRRYFAPDGDCDGEVPVDQALLTAVMSGVLRPSVPPINTFSGAVVEDTRVLGEKPAFYQFAALVCRLVLSPQW